MSSKVSVLLSTYNGENYLVKQIDSILNQSYSDFILIIRDDGSSDNSLQIIKNFKDSRIKILDSDGNVGIVRSFSILLEAQDSDYFFFCDQDDIWEKDKIAFQVEILKKKEIEEGNEKPYLTHSDLTLIDSEDHIFFHSLWIYGKIRPNRNSLNYLLVQPIVTGCAMAGNKKLADLMKPIPEDVFMHDWWASLIASAYGKIIPTSKPLIKYRIHESNRLGMSNATLWNSVLKFKAEKYKEFYNASILQAKAFVHKYKIQELDLNFRSVFTLSQIYNYNRVKRISILLKYKIFRSNITRNLYYFIYTFLN